MDTDIAYKEIRILKINLKKAILKEIDKIGLDKKELGKKLDILPSGVEILFSHDYWTIEKSICIIKLLNLKTRLIIKNEKG